MARRLLTVLAAVLVAGALAAAPALAQTGPGYQPGSGPPGGGTGGTQGPGYACSGYACHATLSLSSATVTVGQQVTVTGAGYPAGATVNLTFNSTPIDLGSVVADASGGFSKAIVVPNVPLGAHTITGATSSGVTASASLTVVAAAAAVPTGTTGTGSGGSGLAFTGADIGLMAAVAALLLLVGGGLLLASRKRRMVG